MDVILKLNQALPLLRCLIKTKKASRIPGGVFVMGQILQLIFQNKNFLYRNSKQFGHS